MRGFKDFLTRGNLIELAVAFIMGAAFTTVVSSFTDLIMRIIARFTGGQPNLDAWTLFSIPVGPFLTALLNFLIVALVVYLFIVAPINRYRARHDQAGIGDTESEIDLLTQIRDRLPALNAAQIALLRAANAPNAASPSTATGPVVEAPRDQKPATPNRPGESTADTGSSATGPGPTP